MGAYFQILADQMGYLYSWVLINACNFMARYSRVYLPGVSSPMFTAFMKPDSTHQSLPSPPTKVKHLEQIYQEALLMFSLVPLPTST